MDHSKAANQTSTKISMAEICIDHKKKLCKLSNRGQFPIRFWVKQKVHENDREISRFI